MYKLLCPSEPTVNKQQVNSSQTQPVLVSSKFAVGCKHTVCLAVFRLVKVYSEYTETVCRRYRLKITKFFYTIRYFHITMFE